MDANEEKTHEATLVHGNNYIFDGVHFKGGKSRPVTESMASKLEELSVFSRDRRTGDSIEHKRFDVSLIGESNTEDDEEEVQVSRTRRPSRRTAARSR